jgi:hypothetical protein
MHTYDYETRPKSFLTPEIVSLLTRIHEHKGKQKLFIEAYADTLSSLLGKLPKKEILEVFCIIFIVEVS